MVYEKTLLEQYNTTRRQTVRLTEGLSAEDLTAQSMPDASPAKWHLAHTTWFFETFILQKFDDNFDWFDRQFCYLFNSYYDAVGSRHARPQRGLLTRPGLQEVIDYRDHVDGRMQEVIARDSEAIASLLTIGLHHEMQHQELFLTDLLHLFSHNPLHPSVLDRQPAVAGADAPAAKMIAFDGGLVEVGAKAQYADPWAGFSYDCEQPQHKTFLSPFKLASRLSNNHEWMAFIDDGGYDDPMLWLSDGWASKNREDWRAPLYWQQMEGVWYQYGLDGLQKVDPLAPVSHVSYYEADAFARWSGKRLPREHEWEQVARPRAVVGNFLESYTWRPFAAQSAGEDFEDLYGDVWEWTQSAFSPYPGFVAKQGALGEYNGKFMANQYVLKGGSCVTPRLQMRASYRNFFYPHQRWQFMGVRLAEDS